MPTNPVKKATEELQQRILEAASDIATPSWLRAYWRAHPHRLVDLATGLVPKPPTSMPIQGTGPNGEIQVTVQHSIKRSVLDELPAPIEVRAERLPDD